MNPEKRTGTKLKSTSCSEKQIRMHCDLSPEQNAYRKLLVHYGRLEKWSKHVKSRLEYEEHEKQQTLEILHLHKQFEIGKMVTADAIGYDFK